MIKEFKIRFLKRLAHLLSPYMEKELDVRKAQDLDWYKSQLKSCGLNVTIGPSYILRGMNSISIGDNFYASAHLRLETIEKYEGVSYSPQLTIGNDVVMQEFCHIGCVDSVSIGDGTLLASKVFISDHMHGNISAADLSQRPEMRELSHKPVSIGKNVWIGEGVSIMPGVTLGDNVIVGANAVVTHSFPENSVIAGCPAKLIKTLK